MRQLDNDIANRMTVRGQLSDEVWGQLSDEVWDQLISKIYLDVWDDVRNATYYQLSNQVRRHIRNEVILRTVGDKVIHALNEAR